MTMMRLRRISRKTPNAQHPTSNIQLSEMDVARWALSVGRWTSFRELPDDLRRIPGDNDVRFDVLCHYRPCCDNRVLPDGHAFQDHGVHANPHVIPDDDRRGLELRTRWSIFEKWF